MTQKHSGRMRRLLAAGLSPERAGQPVKALVHVPLDGLLLLEGSSALQEEWAAGVRARRAAARAAASVSGSDGGAWLDGDAARAFTCDASVTPVVTGEVDPGVLEDLVRLCAQLGKLQHHHADHTGTGDGGGSAEGTGGGTAPAGPGPAAGRAREALAAALGDHRRGGRGPARAAVARGPLVPHDQRGLAPAARNLRPVNPGKIGASRPTRPGLGDEWGM